MSRADMESASPLRHTLQATGKLPEADGFKIRRSTVEHAIPCLTSLDTAKAVLDVLTVTRRRRLIYSMAMQDYAGNNRPVRELN